MVERKRTVPVARTEEETITVTASIGTSKNKRDEKRESRQLSVRKFLVEPAYVRVSVGQTINLGDYESQRIDVAVSIPCYAEEVDVALEQAADKAAVFLESELEKWDVGHGKNTRS